MIFDSLGLGELGIIAVLILLLVEPKKVGHFIREAKKYKRKAMNFQHNMRNRLDELILEQENRELKETAVDNPSDLRSKFRDHIHRIPSMERAQSSRAILTALSNWEPYQNARVVSCFIGIDGEIDTEAIARKILADEKVLLVPFIPAEHPYPAEPANSVSREPESPPLPIDFTPGLAPVENFDADLVEGRYGIREPRADLRVAVENRQFVPDLHLVPGLVFDTQGGRIGKGMGFYDRLLNRMPGIRAALCFAVQVTEFNLPLQPHDQKMDFIISEQGVLKAENKENQV